MISTNEQIRKLYFESKLKQNEFAIKCDLTPARFNEMINSKSEVRFSTLEKICKNLNKKIKIVIE